ncbi:MAG TPA: DUF378 domain-containing protein [Candidatus Paceibacterota bacterium]|jgi:uncharacterized membrane protein YuzA (DUF378 family)|nr:DUF378 domain-containing protein [Candidatus Paceibacterota bacterium]
MLFKWLLIIGGINWGLVGLGWLFGGANWNLVHLIFGFSMTLEAIIYLLVGVAGVIWLFGGCKKGKHHECVCTDDKMAGGSMGGGMQGGQGKM